MAAGTVHIVNPSRSLASIQIAADHCVVFEWLGEHAPREGDVISGFLEAVGEQVLHDETQGVQLEALIHVAGCTCERATLYVR